MNSTNPKSNCIFPVLSFTSEIVRARLKFQPKNTQQKEHTEPREENGRKVTTTYWFYLIISRTYYYALYIIHSMIS